MPSAMKVGLTLGASKNNFNVVQWHTGMRLVRATVTDASATVSARTILSRVTLDNVTKIDSYTLLAS